MRTFWGWNGRKNKNIEPELNFTGSYLKKECSAFVWRTETQRPAILSTRQLVQLEGKAEIQATVSVQLHFVL